MGKGYSAGRALTDSLKVMRSGNAPEGARIERNEAIRNMRKIGSWAIMEDEAAWSTKMLDKASQMLNAPFPDPTRTNAAGQMETPASQFHFAMKPHIRNIVDKATSTEFALRHGAAAVDGRYNWALAARLRDRASSIHKLKVKLDTLVTRAGDKLTLGSQKAALRAAGSLARLTTNTLNSVTRARNPLDKYIG